MMKLLGLLLVVSLRRRDRRDAGDVSAADTPEPGTALPDAPGTFRADGVSQSDGAGTAGTALPGAGICGVSVPGAGAFRAGTGNASGRCLGVGHPSGQGNSGDGKESVSRPWAKNWAQATWTVRPPRCPNTAGGWNPMPQRQANYAAGNNGSIAAWVFWAAFWRQSCFAERKNHGNRSHF